MLVTISGLPGSGTSTVAVTVADRLGVAHLDGGSVFRALAAERGMSLAAFGALAETDPTIDLELDARLATAARQGSVVLESRLAGWIVANEGLAGATTVWIACDERERARRVGAREGVHVDAALAANRARERSEATRYRTYYGIDIGDLSPYAVVLDSTSATPGELVSQLLEAVQ